MARPKRFSALLARVAVTVLFVIAPVSGQTSSIRGRVIDQDTRAGIRGVMIRIQSANRAVLSNEEGAFLLQRLRPGRHELRFEMLGFTARSDTVAVSMDEEVTVVVAIARRPIELPPLRVEARVGARTAWLGARGFFQRGETGQARLHLTQEQLVHQTARNLQEVLRHTPGVRIRRLVDGGGELLLDPSPLPNGERCPVSVYLNGSRVEFGKFIWKGVRWDQTAMRPMRFDDLLQLEEVDGIELYGPEESPVATGSCGVLLLWSEKIRPTVDEPLTGTVRGQAVDAASGAPIAGVRVTLRPGSMTILTNDSGQFEFADVVPGGYELIAEQAGAEAWHGGIQVRAYGIVTIELQIERRAGAALETRLARP